MGSHQFNLARTAFSPSCAFVRRKRRQLAPRLEHLEARLVLSTLTVTSAADSGQGSLRATIASASGGDTIVFAPRLDGETISLTSGELAINQSLTIKGPGANELDVDAAGASRVFDITSSSSTVTIVGLTISGGNAEDGGGILDQGGTLTLKDDSLSNDHAIGVNPGDTAQGGGVEVTDSGSLAVLASSFLDDLAQGAVGASGGNAFSNGQGGDGDGGAIFADNGTSLSISGSTFRQNQAIGGAGGSGGTGIVDGAGGNGNGAAIDTMSNTLSVTNSTFTGDLAQGGAGGVGLTFGVNGDAGGGFGTVEMNSATATATFTFSGDVFSSEVQIGAAGTSNASPGVGGQGGLGGSTGGVITNNFEQSVTVTNCTFTSNIAQCGAGGNSGTGVLSGDGGDAEGGVVENVGNLTISGSSFTDNVAIGGAGGNGGDGGNGGPGGPSGEVVFANANLTLANTTFTGNQQIGGVGGVGGDGGVGGTGLEHVHRSPYHRWCGGSWGRGRRGRHRRLCAGRKPYLHRFSRWSRSRHQHYRLIDQLDDP
jgi:hypothetical protein